MKKALPGILLVLSLSFQLKAGETYKDTIVIKNAIDTILQGEKSIILFRDNTWYFTDDLYSGLYFIDTLAPLMDTHGIFMSHWSIDTLHYVTEDLVDMDYQVALPLVDEYHPFFTVPTKKPVTYKFGFMRYLYHYGIDMEADIGDNIYACFDGKVRYARYNWGGYGNLVIVRHHNGLETYYSHLSSISVKEDQLIRAGTLVGKAGRTGRATGPHLHFEVRYEGNALDPETIFDFEHHSLRMDTLVIDSTNFAYVKEIRKRVYHTIRPGDTLGHLAIRYHTTVYNICKLNGFYSNSILRVGRSIRVR